MSLTSLLKVMTESSSARSSWRKRESARAREREKREREQKREQERNSARAGAEEKRETYESVEGDDGVQRRSQFVTDICQEPIFRV